MKKIAFCRKLILLSFLSLLIITACSSPTSGGGGDDDNKIDKDWEKFKIRENLTTQKLVEEMGIGINLGNTLDACGDWITGNNINNFVTAWGSPVPTKAMIAGYAKGGFSSLRIPVAWSNLMNLDGYIINPDLFALVENVVNWTIDNGMVALVDLHYDNGWWRNFPTDYDECMKRYKAIWTQICGRFKNYGDRLVFESMNEVGFDDIWTPWSGSYSDKKKAFDLVNDLNQTFVDIVRASGGNNGKRHLLINVYNTGLEYAYDPLFKMPSDPANRMAASVHYYTPAVFAILEEDADWGTARSTWGTTADLNELTNNMNLLKANCVNKGIPVIIGEFAACGNNKTEEMKRLFAVSVAEAVYSRGMCPMLWDTKDDQYNRSTFTFRDSLLIEQFKQIRNKYSR